MKRKIKNILITRQPEQSVSFVNLLSKSGYHPFLLPMIETVGLAFNCVDRNYDYLIFTSVNAVRYFSHCFKNIKWKFVIAVGEKTAKHLRELDINVDFIPKNYSSQGLIELLSGFNLSGKKFLIPTTKKRSDLLESFLKDNKAEAEFLYIYDTKSVIYQKGYINEFVNDNKIDVITFASPSAAKSFLSQSDLDLNDFIVVSIGKTTADFLDKKGIKSYFPAKFTVDGMVSLIINLDRGLI